MLLQLFVVLVSFGSIHSKLFASRSKVYEFAIQNEEQINAVLAVQKDSGFDIWQYPQYPEKNMRVMVTEERQTDFEKLLQSAACDYKVTITDVEKALEAERSTNLIRTRTNNNFTFDAYHRYDKMIEYMQNLTEQYPIVKMEAVGKSYENLTMYALRISKKSNSSKPQVFIDGGIHAREWIAPAVAFYIIHQLLENQTESNARLLDRADWLILPVVNPDGYEYTHTTDRLWRKTRSHQYNSTCLGVDGNRNYGYEWGGAGSSSDPCSLAYSGPHAFSEPEVRAVRDLLLNENKTTIYLTLHSHGNLLLYPWGYSTALPQDWARLHELATNATHAIEAVNGTKYRVGSSALLLGMSAGSSRDFARGAANIRTPYTVELPSGGPSGFELPPDQILPASREIFEGIRYLVNNDN